MLLPRCRANTVRIALELPWAMAGEYCTISQFSYNYNYNYKHNAQLLHSHCTTSPICDA
jgi:hypothetical protein